MSDQRLRTAAHHRHTHTRPIRRSRIQVCTQGTYVKTKCPSDGRQNVEKSGKPANYLCPLRFENVDKKKVPFHTKGKRNAFTYTRFSDRRCSIIVRASELSGDYRLLKCSVFFCPTTSFDVIIVVVQTTLLHTSYRNFNKDTNFAIDKWFVIVHET